MQQQQRPAVIALGMFDGMHLGHQSLIRTAVRLARAQGLCSMVYTFENHPMSVFATPPQLLSSPEERREAMLALGVERVEMVRFDRALAGMEPAGFARLLVERYQARVLVAGFNYTFGSRGAGTVETLRALGEALGFRVQREEPVLDGGEPISSTRIRRMLAQGDAQGAARLLGRPYRLYGHVGANRRIGTALGFPTANLEPPRDKLLPRAGVYATAALTAQGRFPAVTNIGDNPTVQGKRTTIETHILDFQGDLYGTALCVELLAYLRPEQDFGSRALLAQQIARDVAHARAYMGTQA